MRNESTTNVYVQGEYLVKYASEELCTLQTSVYRPLGNIKYVDLMDFFPGAPF